MRLPSLPLCFAKHLEVLRMLRRSSSKLIVDMHGKDKRVANYALQLMKLELREIVKMSKTAYRLMK